jgi:hypothetical protein
MSPETKLAVYAVTGLVLFAYGLNSSMGHAW